MSSYETWKKAEINWIQEAEKKLKKKNRIYYLLTPPGCAVILGLIGLMAGGGAALMLQNFLIGLGVGIFIALLTWLMVAIPAYPGKKFIKSMKNDIENVLSLEERERFAEQMLAQGDTLKCFTWKSKDKTETRLQFSEDYAYLCSESGYVILVLLYKVKQIVTDIEQYDVNFRSSGWRFASTVTHYPMNFYYQTPGPKVKHDVQITFEAVQTREPVSLYLAERGLPVKAEKNSPSAIPKYQ